MAKNETTLVIPERNPKQEQFFNATKRFVAYGGARGGGKSWAARWNAAVLALKHNGIRILIVRRTYKELRENYIKPMLKDLATLIKDGVVRYNDDDKCFYFKNRSEIILGYCDGDSDLPQYQGMEYDVLFIDEATQLTEFQFNTLCASVRGANDFPKRVYLTCNPGGIGHEWVKRLFISRKYQGEENPDDYLFIPATVYDNTVLMEKDPGYLKMLNTLPDGVKQAWRDGDWDYIAGKFFDEFNKKTHVIEPCELKAHWRRYVALDYGFDMLAALWIALDEKGNKYVYREVYEQGKTISDAARRIAYFSDGEKIEMFLAPPDLWARQRETGRTTADIFAECGVPLTKTSNNRVHGWRAVREDLKLVPDADENYTARLKIFKTCENLIRCLPLLRFDKKNLEDCATEPHEITHAPDALRYFCVYWTSSADELPREQRIPIAFKYFAPAKTDNGTGYGEKIQVI